MQPSYEMLVPNSPLVKGHAQADGANVSRLNDSYRLKIIVDLMPDSRKEKKRF